MLDPGAREALTEQLRPPAGYKLSHAVGTTFTLDMISALAVPPSFVRGSGEDPSNAVALLNAVRKVSDRVDIFCQAGLIRAPHQANDFHWWSHSVIHWNVPTNPVDFEQREGRVHRYMGHAVRKNVAAAHWQEVLSAGVRNPWEALFKRAEVAAAARPQAVREFAPYWIHPGEHRIERRLLDHPLSRDVLRTQRMLSGLAEYRLALGQARQDDLLETLRNTAMKPLDLSP